VRGKWLGGDSFVMQKYSSEPLAIKPLRDPANRSMVFRSVSLLVIVSFRSQALLNQRLQTPLHAKMPKEPLPEIAPKSSTDWMAVVARYQTPAVKNAVWQLTNTLVPYALIWCAIYFLLPVSFWLALPLAVLGGGFLVRAFIIFHDCGHGSFFPSRQANDIVGYITGVLTFTPYRHWTREHAIHHATSGDLDRRGRGDVWTLTVQEYLEASRWQRFAYRLARNPFILFGLGPIYLFLIKHRFAGGEAGPRERRSVLWTNVGILVVAAGLSYLVGLKAYLILQFIMTFVGGAAGVWLFYVQHQFEDAHWEPGENWDYTEAALKGSSFYKLPKVLQWFSGNIGFHHIHHLSPAIPNYRLEKCHKSEPLFREVKPVTLFSSLKALTYRLWDERRQKLVGYAGLRLARIPKSPAADRHRRDR
jgi:omega-6 fatty acid desaturase (delta-12 desaturase)